MIPADIMIARIKPGDWTRARTDLELAWILAERRVEITQPGLGDLPLDEDDIASEAIAEVRRRAIISTCSDQAVPESPPLGSATCT